jgi:hypothetical protein
MASAGAKSLGTSSSINDQRPSFPMVASVQSQHELRQENQADTGLGTSKLGRGSHSQRLQAAREGKTWGNSNAEKRGTGKSRLISDRDVGDGLYPLQGPTVAHRATTSPVAQKLASPAATSTLPVLGGDGAKVARVRTDGCGGCGGRRSDHKTVAAPGGPGGQEEGDDIKRTRASSAERLKRGADSAEHARQRRGMQSLRLRVDLLWEELHVPMRDRKAVTHSLHTLHTCWRTCCA